MTPREIVEAVERLPVEERTKFLERLTGSNPTLRLEVETLLAGRGSLIENIQTVVPNGFSSDTKNNIDGIAGETVISQPTKATAAVRSALNFTGITGRYQILRPHAKGGLGEVSVASDLELPREVAFKEIQPQFVGSETSRARFVLEAEITGGLEHPGIVPVYGLGKHPDGRPYYAMRFIQGDNLDAAIKKFHENPNPNYHSVEFRELLGRFLDVCQAIAYAHSRGVLHRDIKPGNIMLGKFGETLVVDWGLAKIIDRVDNKDESEPLYPRSGTTSGSETQSGSVIGTPIYMSPEQAAGKIEELGPAADIYSLGATLYTVIAGKGPIEKGPMSEVLERVRKGQIRPLLQAQPGTPKSLSAVCHKALALDPIDRYLTAQELADDLQRYLADEPVKAVRDPMIVRVRRWMRKHPGPSAAVAATLLVGILSLGVGNYLLGAKNDQLAGLNTQLEGLNTELEGKNVELTKLNTDLGTANSNLKVANTRAENREKEAIDAVKRFADAVSENHELKNSEQLASLRKELLKEPLAYFKSLREQLQAGNDTSPESMDRLGEAAFQFANLSKTMGDLQDSIDAFEEVLLIFGKLAKDHPQNPDYRRYLASTHSHIGYIQSVNGKPEKSLESHERALELQKVLVIENPTNQYFRRELAGIHSNIGVMLSDIGKYEEGLKQNKQALLILEKLIQDYPESLEFREYLAINYSNLGRYLIETGRIEEALTAVNQGNEIMIRLTEQYPSTIDYQSLLGTFQFNIGSLLERLGRTEEARIYFDKALNTRERLVQIEPSVTEYQRDLAKCYDNMGTLHFKAQTYQDGLNAFIKAQTILEDLVQKNPTHRELRMDFAVCLNNIGRTFNNLDQPADAASNFEQALKVWSSLTDDNITSLRKQNGLATCNHNYAVTLEKLGKLDQALHAYKEVITLRLQLLMITPNDSSQREFLARCYYDMANLQIDLNDAEGASRSFKDALLIFQQLASESPNIPEFHSLLGGTLNNLATIDLSHDRYPEARVHLLQAVDSQKRAFAMDRTNPKYRAYLINHFSNILYVAGKLNDLEHTLDARHGLAELALSDPKNPELNRRLPLVLQGSPVRDNDERVALASHAYNTARYALSARLWREAFDADPKLKDPTADRHLLSAAGAAALAGFGDWDGDLPLSTSEKSSSRTQARLWLSEELDTVEKFLNSATNEQRSGLLGYLGGWKSEADFIELRGEFIDILPEDERAPWKEFWTRVDNLILKFSPKQT